MGVKLGKKNRLRVPESRVLINTFGPNKEEVTGHWRKVHNENLHDLCCSPNTIRVINSRNLICAGHVARLKNGYRVLV
jgi:hypothetical protein